MYRGVPALEAPRTPWNRIIRSLSGLLGGKKVSEQFRNTNTSVDYCSVIFQKGSICLTWITLTPRACLFCLALWVFACDRLSFPRTSSYSCRSCDPSWWQSITLGALLRNLDTFLDHWLHFLQRSKWRWNNLRLILNTPRKIWSSCVACVNSRWWKCQAPRLLKALHVQVGYEYWDMPPPPQTCNVC